VEASGLEAGGHARLLGVPVRVIVARGAAVHWPSVMDHNARDKIRRCGSDEARSGVTINVSVRTPSFDSAISQKRPVSEDLARSGALFGYETLTGKLSRSGFLLLALSNGLGALLQEATPSMRVARGSVAVLALLGYFWVRRGVPSYRARLLAGIAMTAWIIGSIAIETRDGWPPRIERVPPACVYLALAVDWRLALALFFGMFAALGGAYLTGYASLPPHFMVTAGNWLTVGVVLLFVVHLQLRFFAAGIADLMTSTRSLDLARAQAAAVTDELAHRVSERFAALVASLQAGPSAAVSAARGLAETLQQSRQRVPPEASLSFGKLRGRVISLRREMLRAFIVLGAVVIPLQVIRLWLSGMASMAYVVSGVFVLLLGIAWYVVRHPSHWRGASRITAVVLTLGFIVTFRHWIGIPDGPVVPPPVSLYLLAVVMLGVVTGDLWLMVVTGALMAISALLLAGSRGMMSVLVALIFLPAGVMITNLPSDLLAVIQKHQREALDAIRRRRRIVGTLFHDLANPLMVVALHLDEAVETGTSDIPEDVTVTVSRMQATIDAALGRIDAPEPLTVRALVDALIMIFRRPLETKELRLVCVGDLDAVIVANRTLLQDTVLANLFSNAIKFSPEGADITLHVYRGGGEVRMEVRDHGPGLPESVRLAVEAGRVAPSRIGSAGEVGSGYGLLLASDYLREMGGALSFEARQGGGLTVRVTLPAA